MEGQDDPRDRRTAQVAVYKTVLRDILDRRPSGTRQRLATVLGKNRSFVSQISNPAYSVPIPAQHLEPIFDICHFPPAEKRTFLEAYALAHPGRLKTGAKNLRRRNLTLDLPDLGSARRNRDLDELLRETARRLARLLHDDE